MFVHACRRNWKENSIHLWFALIWEAWRGSARSRSPKNCSRRSSLDTKLSRLDTKILHAGVISKRRIKNIYCWLTLTLFNPSEMKSLSKTICHSGSKRKVYLKEKIPKYIEKRLEKLQNISNLWEKQRFWKRKANRRLKYFFEGPLLQLRGIREIFSAIPNQC